MSSSSPFCSRAIQNGYSKQQIDFFLRIVDDYPQFRFIFGKKFAFRPPRTIVIGPFQSNAELLMLHELGHAVSSHIDFNTDARRLKMEVEAWEKAKNLALKYQMDFDDELMECELDTYRNWLHQKSRCPKCGLTRFQTPDSRYHCPRCENLT